MTINFTEVFYNERYLSIKNQAIMTQKSCEKKNCHVFIKLRAMLMTLNES